MSSPLLDLIAPITITTIEGRPLPTGLTSVLYLSGAADAGLQGKVYTSAAEVSADVAATDLPAAAGADILAILAQGPRVARVILGVYDAGGGSPETPDDAIDAVVAAGLLPGWAWCWVALQARTDDAIGNVADWIATNAPRDAMVFGQLSTSSILSGTVPVTTAASPGAYAAVIVYAADVSDAAARVVGRLASTSWTQQRPSIAFVAPLGATALGLTATQQTAATGRDVGQARCWIVDALYPVASRPITYRGFTVGGTLAEVEIGAMVAKRAVLGELGRLLEARSISGIPLTVSPVDQGTVAATCSGALGALARIGWFSPSDADVATGRPAMPDGYLVSVSGGGTTIRPVLTVSIAGDVRVIDADLTIYAL